MASKKQHEANLKIAGEIDPSLKASIEKTEKEMAQISEAVRKAEGATRAYSDTIKKQEKVLRAAQTAYKAYALSGQEATEEAQALASDITRLSADLESNKAAFAAAERAASGLVDDYASLGDSAGNVSGKIKESGNSAKSAGDGFTVAKGAAAALVAQGFSKLVSGATDAVRALFSLSEQTKEFRRYMSSLDTAFAQAEFSSEQASSTWSEMYAIIGDEDQATEAANNIARVSYSQADLDKWTRIAAGTWGVFEKALPIENLAEAAGETARTGTVTGGLADALNWSTEAAEMFSNYMGGDVVTAEDAFNVALSKCSTEQERQALIMDTLNKLYGDAGDEYIETAGSLYDAGKATGEMLQAQAKLGEIMEPVNTQWTRMKTQLMLAVAPALEKVSGKLQEALTWMQAHPQVLQALIIAFGVLAGAITVITVAVAAYTAVQMLANAALLPVIGIALAIAAGIAALISIGYLLITNWDSIKQKAFDVWVSVTEKWNALKTAVINAAKAVAAGVVAYWNALVSSIKSIWDGILNFLSGIWDKIKSTASSFANGVVNTIQSGWSKLTSILTAPFTAVSSAIGRVSSKVSSLVSKVKNAGSSLVGWLPGFAAGGFTQGVSIAGEAGTEAVISFDPKYRADNLRYWAQAGRMLGADASDFTLSGSSSTTNTSTTVIDSVNFSPNITITGDAKKQDIIDAIRATYPEFMDLIEQVLEDREVGVYA